MNSNHPAAFIDAFSDAADLYAASRPTYPARLFEHLVSLAPAKQSAWDCGTGNGQAARALAQFFSAVTATDASAAQIAQAETHPRIQYRVGPAESSGLPDRSVDLISVAQALHWFDLKAFNAEVRRVARPGAVLAIYGYSWFYLTPALDALTDQWLLDPIKECWSPNNRLLWDGYATIDFPFEELRAPRLAIHLSWSLDQLFDYYGTWSATRRTIESSGEHFIRSARARFESAWGPPEQRRHVVMPLAIRLGRVT